MLPQEICQRNPPDSLGKTKKSFLILRQGAMATSMAMGMTMTVMMAIAMIVMVVVVVVTVSMWAVVMVAGINRTSDTV